MIVSLSWSCILQNSAWIFAICRHSLLIKNLFTLLHRRRKIMYVLEERWRSWGAFEHDAFHWWGSWQLTIDQALECMLSHLILWDNVGRWWYLPDEKDEINLSKVTWLQVAEQGQNLWDSWLPSTINLEITRLASMLSCVGYLLSLDLPLDGLVP